MTDPVIERPARRFLHICYCCADDLVVADFLVAGLDMRQVMRTTDHYSSGAILGLDYDVHSVGNFVYDHRGPRTSPAIEVQAWFDPAVVGEPSIDPFEAGIKTLGFAVPSLDAAVERLVGLGCTVVADGQTPFDGRCVVLLDPRRVTIELVEDADLAEGTSRLHHLRATVLDLDASVAFYDMLGFDVIDQGEVTDGGFVGYDGPATGRTATLRLPDEATELRIVQWLDPVSHGRNYTEPYHAGLFRAALGVDDTRASYALMCERGAQFDRPPMPVELAGTPVPDMWITFITDPDGIPWEFVQRPRSIFR